MGKMSQTKIARKYFDTLYVRSYEGDSVSIIDILVQLILPAAIGIALGVRGVVLDGDALLTAVATVTALLGTVVVFLFQVRLQVGEILEKVRRLSKGESATARCGGSGGPPQPASPEVTYALADGEARGTTISNDDVELIDELFHQMMWAIVVGIAISVIGVMRDTLTVEWQIVPEAVVSSIQITLSLHMATVLLMCTKRFSSIYCRIAVGER